MGRVRARVTDKRVLALVKAFLKAGILTELGEQRDTPTGTPQGGILSPLLANIALSVLDEQVHAPWRPGGAMSTSMRRQTRRKKGLPNWRIIRYADDFVILVHGTRDDALALRETVADVLAPMGLRLSQAKTSVRQFSDGFDFLGFHIRWKRKAGTNKWYVYTFIADRPVKALKAKLRALTHRTSLADLGATLIRLNQIQCGWAAYFRHAVATHTFKHLRQFLWWRIVRWLKTRHRWRWTALRRHLTDHTGRWKPISADGIELFNLETVGITRYRYRGAAIPNPWNDHGKAVTVESPLR
jgi:RNA-directed DNA polymerase